MQSLLFLLTLLQLSTPITAAKKLSNAILLSSVKSLTFHADRLTTSRRVDPIPQLTCTGGTAASLYTPSTIRCTNAGSSYSSADVEWTCTADLPPEFRLGSTDVVCEGYESSDDEYVLKGSCGVEYRLGLTKRGEEVYGDGWKGKMKRESSDGGGGGDGSRRTGGAAGVVGRRGGGGDGGFWGGGGDTGNDDPPPPYSPSPSKPPVNASRYSSATRQNRAQRQGWQPGFWTGAAAGAAGGWFAGQQRQQPMAQRGGGGWFDGRYDAEEGSSAGRRAGFGGGGSSPSYSSERYMSTGFGGTRRR